MYFPETALLVIWLHNAFDIIIIIKWNLNKYKKIYLNVQGTGFHGIVCVDIRYIVTQTKGVRFEHLLPAKGSCVFYSGQSSCLQINVNTGTNEIQSPNQRNQTSS